MVLAVRNVEKTDDKIGYVAKLLGQDKLDMISGSYQKIIAPSEEIVYPNDKRSIHAVQNIKKGNRLTKENISVLRSERNLNPGMAPKFYN